MQDYERDESSYVCCSTKVVFGKRLPFFFGCVAFVLRSPFGLRAPQGFFLLHY